MPQLGSHHGIVGDNSAEDQVRVATKEFGAGVDNKVCSIVEGTLID